MEDNTTEDTKFDELKIWINKTYRNPRIGKTLHAVLKEGPRAYHVATIFEILKSDTGELHHLSLKIGSYARTKNGWQEKPDMSITLDGDKHDEILKLNKFLQAVVQEHYPEQAGAWHLLNANKYRSIKSLLTTLNQIDNKNKLKIVRHVIDTLDKSSTDANEFITAFERSNGEILNHISVASRFVEYRNAYNEFAHLVKNYEQSETKLQKHLEKHPWIFGSEYSELLPRRNWTRDDRLDFMLRRTVDGYLEIVEIKTPFKDALFNYDKSHDSYYPSAKLSVVIGQTLRYIEEIEQDRLSIIAKDDEDPLKVRARIIIGRDGNAQQRTALRNLNAHLHRIEIFTFDQLLRVGNRVLGVFQEQIKQEKEETAEDDDDDIPF